MYPMAEVMVKTGHSISGSDRQRSTATKRLESLGVGVQYHHEPDLVKDCELLVYSSAIKSNNLELVYAGSQGIPCMKRAEMLGDIMRANFSIGVAGTHGKTTTTSLIGNIFNDAGKNPVVIVGGAFRDSESHAIVGEGSLLVTEADEYDRSFLSMFPTLAVVTNIEADHLDIYDDLDDIINAFVEYVNKVPFYGIVVVCEDDPMTTQIRGRINETVISYGITESATYQAKAIRFEKGRAIFDVVKEDNSFGTVILPLTGLHNIRNALAAITVAHEMDIPFDVIQKSLKDFKGIKRRFEVIGTAKEITIVDDYAHHPSEISATLDAAKHAGFKRRIAVFQPHLYTRTRDFCNEFAEGLAEADVAVVTDIYKAREEPITGVHSDTIVKKMQKKGHGNAHYINALADIPDLLVPMLEPGDGVILMGAGNIWEISETLLKRIRHG